VQASTKTKLQLTVTLALLLIPSWLHAWSTEGHEIVAMLAEQRLQPDVREVAMTLLEGETFVGAASWADKVRNEQTAPWHYVNIQLADTDYDPGRVCPQDQCVIGQIERFSQVLADPNGDVRKRQKALKYLIHFVADLHQPLHAADNHDRGGNDLSVEFLESTINPYNSKSWNLHAVWDRGLLIESDPDPRRYAERLAAWLTQQPAGAFQDGSVVDWAMESHRIAREHAYVLPPDHKLGEDYVRVNGPVVDQQLAKAGVRLARLLNKSLKTP